MLSEYCKQIKIQASSAFQLIVDTHESGDRLKAVDSQLKISGTTLKSINKWVETIKELEHELHACEYDYYQIVADLLNDVKEQSLEFKSYYATSYVILIQEKVITIENQLKRQVQWSFREIGQLAASDPDINPSESSKLSDTVLDMQNLNQIYLLIDVLGYEFRIDLLERFAQLQLIPYEKWFKLNSKYCGLDSLDKRYNWLRNLIKNVDDKLGKAFPRKWNVGYYLFIEFSRRTKKHLSDFLKVNNTMNTNDLHTYVNNTLISLKSILSFEAEMKASFEVYSRGEMDDENRINFDTKESISEAFDPYLGPYVQLEREALDTLMNKLSDEESRIMYEPLSADGANSLSKGPFDSSRQMFEYIKNSLKRCTAFSIGLTYLSLSKEYRICLHNYAESLKFRCPSPTLAKAGKPPSYEISINQELYLCRIISSGEYCIDTIPSLEVKMKDTIKSIYSDEIDFQSQIDAYVDMINFTQSIIIAGIETKLEISIKELKKINWSNVSNVGDDSKYVKSMIAVMNDTIPRIRANISKNYFTNFVMKFVTFFLDLLLENIYSLKRINMTGAGQLLLDLNGIKTYLLTMPQTKFTATEEKDIIVISKAYKTIVNTKINKIEIVLKLVCAEDDRLQEMFQLLWPEGTQNDYDLIMSLKTRNILPIPVPAALDHVGDMVGKGADIIGIGNVGRGVKNGMGDMTHGITSGASKAFGGLKSSFGDFTGLLFDDAPAKPHHSTTTSKSHPQTTNSAANTNATLKKPTTSTTSQGQPSTKAPTGTTNQSVSKK